MYDSEPMRDDVAVVLAGEGRHGANSDNPLAVVFLEELSVEERKARPEVEDFASREIPLDRYSVFSSSTRTHDLTSYGQFTTVSTTMRERPPHPPRSTPSTPPSAASSAHT
jgi:hypothetical protein